VRKREEWFDKLTMTFVILSLSKDGKEGLGEIFWSMWFYL